MLGRGWVGDRLRFGCAAVGRGGVGRGRAGRGGRSVVAFEAEPRSVVALFAHGLLGCRDWPRQVGAAKRGGEPAPEYFTS